MISSVSPPLRNFRRREFKPVRSFIATLKDAAISVPSFLAGINVQDEKFANFPRRPSFLRESGLHTPRARMCLCVCAPPSRDAIERHRKSLSLCRVIKVTESSVDDPRTKKRKPQVPFEGPLFQVASSWNSTSKGKKNVKPVN